MNSLKEFNRFTAQLSNTEKMPVLFIGHGSPMNGIETNPFSQTWNQLGNDIPKPSAVLVISAHWYTPGTRITAMLNPPTIHDFYGFPPELFAVQYPAPGDPELAQYTAQNILSTTVSLDHDWGLDHGAWSVIRHMYPEANIPVLQLSIDYNKPASFHYELAKELAHLRTKGVLILGSGNMVHNLGMLSWNMINGGGYDWAVEMNEKFKDLILTKNHKPLIQYESLGTAGRLSIPTPEHYLPLLYSLGLQENQDEISFFNDMAVGGSLTMTGVKLS
ncbi:MAG: 4,5-DOPA dioxygenase extradiol [Pedobacter sp.]|nr:MAG: 4,5-DOPA dioxygenase extradiol [Pedobacter sp.]